MDLKYELLSKEFYSDNFSSLLSRVLNSKTFTDELIAYAVCSDKKLNSRACHLLSHLYDAKPEVLRAKMSLLFPVLKSGTATDAQKRNILRILKTETIPEEETGFMCDFCFSAIVNPQEATGVRANALSVLYNLTEFFTELKPELLSVIDEIREQPQLKPALQSCTKKYRTKLLKALKSGD